MAGRRRRTLDTPTSKRPFSNDAMVVITTSIASLFHRVAGKDHHGMGRADVYNMFVAPEHRTTFMYFADVAETGWGTPTTFSARCDLFRVCFQLDKAPVPRNPEMQPDFPQDKLAEYQAWVARRVGLIKEFGLLYYTIEQLNLLCSSRAEIKYFLPGISVLFDVPHKPITNPTALPPEVKNLCRRAATLIATTQLLSFDMPEPVMPDVTLTINKFSWVEEGVGSVNSMVG